MTVEQIVLPFRAGQPTRKLVGDLTALVGRSYTEDQFVTAKVVAVCRRDPRRVLVRRMPGGVVSLPGWLVRSILESEIREKVRKAA